MWSRQIKGCLGPHKDRLKPVSIFWPPTLLTRVSCRNQSLSSGSYTHTQPRSQPGPGIKEADGGSEKVVPTNASCQGSLSRSTTICVSYTGKAAGPLQLSIPPKAPPLVSQERQKKWKSGKCSPAQPNRHITNAFHYLQYRTLCCIFICSMKTGLFFPCFQWSSAWHIVDTQ